MAAHDQASNTLSEHALLIFAARSRSMLTIPENSHINEGSRQSEILPTTDREVESNVTINNERETERLFMLAECARKR